MEYHVIISSRFKKDFKRCMKRGLDMRLITTAMDMLKATGTLPAQYHPHKLVGEKRGIWECHIQPDWLLLWEQHDDQLVLLMLNTGTHSDIYGKIRR